jgi:ankyrin repeat protein
MGCTSSKSAEDKDDISRQNKKHKTSTTAGPATAAASATSTSTNGKIKLKNANNMSGSLSNQNNNNNNSSTNNISASLKQNPTNNAIISNNNNNYINNNNNNNSIANSPSLIESNNLILLTEFFKAVGNGELEKLKQILINVEEINANKKLNNTTSNKKLMGSLTPPPISMTKAELLNAGMIDADGLTALSIAAGRKHKALTEFLADLPEVDVNKASESGITPLLMVAEVGWTDVMRQLLNRGAHVDAAPKGRTAEEAKIAGSTPLIGATKYNNPEAVKLLLEHNANPNHQNQSGISALMLASEQGFYECVKNLCDGGANVELAPSGKTALSMNLSGQTPLFCAAKEGHLEIVKYLLDRNANPNATNHYGVSVLWIPCQRGLTSIVEILLERNANPEIAPSGPEAEERSISGWTPLYAAIKSRQYPVVKLLLNKGANPNAVTSLGSTPFLLASEIGDLEVIKCFVEHGADLDYSPSGKEADDLNITGQTALFMATLKEQNDVVQYLIEKGSKVNVKNRYGVSPLLLCAEGGNETLVKLLVSVGADVNMSPSGDLAVEHILAGQTPLYGAAKKGHYHICKFLIENGADVNAETMTGATPLYTAVEEGHLEICQLLIEFLADVNKCPNGDWAAELNINQQSPLLLACIKNNTQIAELLLENGADPNLVNERGSSSLLVVCQFNNLSKYTHTILCNNLVKKIKLIKFLELLQKLLDLGARIDQEALNLYDAKINALIIATESGSFACVKCLVENGLDVNYRIDGKVRIRIKKN